MLNRLQGVFASFHSHNVRYVVIGGIAAVLHGVPRATFDLDILIEATTENGANILKALESAGFGTATLTTVDDLLAHEITIFNDRVRIDVQTFTPGLLFADAWARRQTMHYNAQPFYVASLPDLIASKKAAGRPRDLEDVKQLERRIATE
ncbi:MAG: DUF6036 family nucleotidyltransferase [Thermoanaerobaculia bacterium]